MAGLVSRASRIIHLFRSSGVPVERRSLGDGLTWLYLPLTLNLDASGSVLREVFRYLRLDPLILSTVVYICGPSYILWWSTVRLNFILYLPGTSAHGGGEML